MDDGSGELFMAEIEFKCPKCKSSLTVDAEAAGMELDCPDCQTIITVPSQSSNLITVEQKSEILLTLTCPSCHVDNDIDEHEYHLRAGQAIVCSGCNFNIPIPPLNNAPIVEKPVSPKKRMKVRNHIIPPSQLLTQNPNFKPSSPPLQQKPLLTPKSPPSPSPQISQRTHGLTVCPHCQTTLEGTFAAGEAVICLTCKNNFIWPANTHPPNTLNIVRWIGFLILSAFLYWLLNGGSLFKSNSETERSIASITINYAEPYTEDLTGCFSFGNWKKEAWGYSGVMMFKGWKTRGGHPNSIAITFESRSSSGVILGQGTVSCPSLSPGQSGRIELIGRGADEANSIRLIMAGTD